MSILINYSIRHFCAVVLLSAIQLKAEDFWLTPVLQVDLSSYRLTERHIKFPVFYTNNGEPVVFSINGNITENSIRPELISVYQQGRKLAHFKPYVIVPPYNRNPMHKVEFSLDMPVSQLVGKLLAVSTDRSTSNLLINFIRKKEKKGFIVNMANKISGHVIPTRFQGGCQFDIKGDFELFSVSINDKPFINPGRGSLKSCQEIAIVIKKISGQKYYKDQYNFMLVLNAVNKKESIPIVINQKSKGVFTKPSGYINVKPVTGNMFVSEYFSLRKSNKNSYKPVVIESRQGGNILIPKKIAIAGREGFYQFKNNKIILRNMRRKDARLKVFFEAKDLLDEGVYKTHLVIAGEPGRVDFELVMSEMHSIKTKIIYETEARNEKLNYFINTNKSLHVSITSNYAGMLSVRLQEQGATGPAIHLLKKRGDLVDMRQERFEVVFDKGLNKFSFPIYYSDLQELRAGSYAVTFIIDTY